MTTDHGPLTTDHQSKSSFAEFLGDALGIGGERALGEVGDQLVELPTRLGSAFHAKQAPSVVEEDNVQKLRVGVVGRYVLIGI